MQAKYSESPAMFKAHPFGFILAVVLIPVVVGAVILLIWYLKNRSTVVEVDEKDLVLVQGFLSKDRTEISLDNIRSIKVHQSVFDRIFNVGKISVFTAGDEPEVKVEGLPDPDRLRKLVKAH
ncbi:PH domain-containing protein [Halioxenophilus aromaticivorans]|uniref:YdbS-like PH domain-containing protein n=1 Tax=Halioxenophilus aromaticivorans TaxID=1306992 RepID=A0AAV3U4W5_9ALTE